jgi:DNA-binding FadR family transcriptional regulator
MPLDTYLSDPLSKFTKYLALQKEDGSQSIPPLSELSKTLDISVASLREQLEVARALGLVDVRPRKGIRKLPYKFSPAVRLSLAYALTTGGSCFEEFADLRKHIEDAYWFEAVAKLTEEDVSFLRSLVDRALEKLNGYPIQIPHVEHRELHLAIYKWYFGRILGRLRNNGAKCLYRADISPGSVAISPANGGCNLRQGLRIGISKVTRTY